MYQKNILLNNHCLIFITIFINVIDKLKVVVIEGVFIDFPQERMFLIDDFFHSINLSSNFLVNQVKFKTRSREVFLRVEIIYCMIFERLIISTVTKLPLRSLNQIPSLINVHFMKKLLFFCDEHARVVVVVAVLMMIDDEKKLVFGVCGDDLSGWKSSL